MSALRAPVRVSAALTAAILAGVFLGYEHHFVLAWMAVPVGWGSTSLPPCARISLMKKYAGIDVQALYPAHQVQPPEAVDWTYDAQLKAAEACAKGGFPFGYADVLSGTVIAP